MSYIGKQPVVGNFQKCDAISVVNGQAAYSLTVGSAAVTPENANHMLVSLNGVLQAPGDSFTVSGSTLTFASNLATGDVIDFVIILGDVLDLGTPSDNSISTAKLVANSVTAAKLNTDIISGQTALGETPADTDELLVSDAGTIKRVDFSHLKSDPGFKLISRQQVSAANSVDFNQVMTATYYQYIFFIEGVQPANNGVNFTMELQTTDESSGSYDTGNNYNYMTMRNNDGNSYGQQGVAFARFSRDGAGDIDSNRLFSGQLNIANASSTTQHKMMYFFGGGQQHDGTDSGQLAFASYADTARLTGARFKFTSGNFQAEGFISLYGLATS